MKRLRSNSNKNHRKGKDTSSFVLYTVYDNKADMPVIVDGEAKDAAKAMGVEFSSFYSIVSKSKAGKYKRWTVLTRFIDEPLEEEIDSEDPRS